MALLEQIVEHVYKYHREIVGMSVEEVNNLELGTKETVLTFTKGKATIPGKHNKLASLTFYAGNAQIHKVEAYANNCVVASQTYNEREKWVLEQRDLNLIMYTHAGKMEINLTGT